MCSFDIIENGNICLNCKQSGILRQRTCDVELKKYCVTLLEKFGALSYTRRTLEELDTEARAEVAKHGGNSLLEDILDTFFEWKLWTDKNKPVQWGSFLPQVMSIMFMCRWELIYICYCYIRGLLKPWQKTVGNVWKIIYAALAFFNSAYSMQYLLLYIILFMLNNMHISQKDMLWIYTVICFLSWRVLKAIFKKHHGLSEFISLVSQLL